MLNLRYLPARVGKLFLCFCLAIYKPAFAVSDKPNYNYLNNAQWLAVGIDFYMDIESIHYGEDLGAIPSRFQLFDTYYLNMKTDAA